MRSQSTITVVGGGLAGSEAAWQLARRGFFVELHEMKPTVFSPAHRSALLAELVCSNSLGSDNPGSASGLLKDELRRAGSLIMEAADANRVPAGKALAVDRHMFSRYIETKLTSMDNISVRRSEMTAIPKDSIVIIATGPLTSDAMSREISSLTGRDNLYFYDALSPVVESSSVDYSRTFWASRYESDSSGDYLNCPMTPYHYECFYRELRNGKEVPLHDFEDSKCFEGCLPIEVLARRGIDALRFGPMKPVGLVDPYRKSRPYAVVQLRKEDSVGELLNMVGFQTKLTWPEQKRIFRLIPGLESASFSRFGGIHRNTFINSPLLLHNTLQMKRYESIFFAGQITGVEGYLESTAMGLIAGLSVSCKCTEAPWIPPPEHTALGALVNYITTARTLNFQPMNVTFGLLPSLSKNMPRRQRAALYAQRSHEAMTEWLRYYL